jgi:ABC-type sugar transport system ATPase subunit
MSAAGEFAIEMRGITKVFPGVRALSDVTIQVTRGHIHALLGENGAGKSTLMKILDGVYAAGAFDGRIALNGAAVAFHSPHDARRKGIGYVPQEIEVIEALTVAENIFVGNWQTRSGVVDFGWMEAEATALLERCRIGLDPLRLVADLGASERQLVMIARALSSLPAVLILDEATACLTRSETGNLFQILRHLQGEGVTTLFITHKLAEIHELADSVTVLRDGAVAARFQRGEFGDEELVAAMVGRKIQSQFPAREPVSGGDEVLRVENLTVPDARCAGRNVVENVSFSLRRGEILGFGGLVGSGRTETLEALYGRRAHTGRIFIDGREASIRQPGDALRHGLGLVTEERKRDGLLFNFGIRENMTLHALRSMSRRGIFSRTRENAAAESGRQRFAIRAPSIEVPVGTLSGGNQQKVVLAKVLLPGPRILLLDEPTKGIDVGAKSEIYRLLAGLVAEGLSLIVISSELPELLGLCDRFIVLARGRIADEFTRAEASEQRLMRAATS